MHPQMEGAARGEAATDATLIHNAALHVTAFQSIEHI